MEQQPKKYIPHIPASLPAGRPPLSHPLQVGLSISLERVLHLSEYHRPFNIQDTIHNQLGYRIACKAIYNMHLYKYWHPEISWVQVKLKISSENSCLTYQQLKPYSEWYRARDFWLCCIYSMKPTVGFILWGNPLQCSRTTFLCSRWPEEMLITWCGR